MPKLDFPDTTPSEEILERTRKARPLLGGPVPADLADRLGATHYDGRYHLTDRPYLLEGLQMLASLGYRAAKLWFYVTGLQGYSFNSNWPATNEETRLVDLARMPYYQQAFAMDFSTFALETHSGQPDLWLEGPEGNDSYFEREEEEFYELAHYLLTTYSERNVTFILQNWEGDWMMRGTGVSWEHMPEDAERRCAGMVRWFSARQRGVERARIEVRQTGCRVFHAAELNKVYDAAHGVPTLLTHVIPFVDLDLVSYSCYDALGDVPVSLWQALEIIRTHARPSSVFGKNQVYVGEIGNPEVGKDGESLISWWDQAMGVLLAMDIPYVFHWELYCNEPRYVPKHELLPGETLSAEELRGFWLIRPDGSKSYAQQYFDRLLKAAGSRIPSNPTNDSPSTVSRAPN